jgi:hypothetical protein
MRIDHARQRLPFDRDRLGRGLGFEERVGDDEGQAIADVERLALGQNGIGGRGDLPVRHARRARERAELDDVLGGEHEAHTRHAARRIGILDLEPRMRMGRAQHGRMAKSFRG